MPLYANLSMVPDGVITVLYVIAEYKILYVFIMDENSSR